jgi:molybdopterin-guanine dinucleotide biosynthesis protein B
MKMQAVAVVGTKKSGKTTTIENLTRELTRKGYKVACIKHINENFTFDTPGKDTWRYRQAGANTIIATGQNQTVTVQKTATPTLAALLEKCRDNDLVFIEGFKKTVAQNPAIPKIAVTKNQTEAQNAMETYSPIIAFTGPYNTTTLNPNIPYANAQTNPKELSDIVENILKKHAMQG